MVLKMVEIHVEDLGKIEDKTPGPAPNPIVPRVEYDRRSSQGSPSHRRGRRV